MKKCFVVIETSSSIYAYIKCLSEYRITIEQKEEVD
jgi:hypothetical protein